MLGLSLGRNPSLDSLFADMESQKVGVSIDWRSTPDEILASLRDIKNWVEPSESISEESADRFLQRLARQYNSFQLSLMNLLPGSDGWFIVIVPEAQVSSLQKAAAKSGLGKAELL